MSATTPDLYGLLGYPLGHTLSPRLHAAAFAWAKRPGTYLALPVPPERLNGAIAGVRAWRLPGLNVTIPHKTAVMPLLDGLTPIAWQIGAVNTLYWEEDRLMGDNTDYAGFKATLPALEGARAVVIGAGGAARAVVAALRDAGLGELTMLARRPEEAAALLEALWPAERPSAVGPLDAPAAEALARAHLLVNTTPVGMDAASCPLGDEAIAQLDPGVLVYDLIYNPAETPLLARARARGLSTRNGLDMLLGQAAHAFERWTGLIPPGEVLRAAL